MKSIRDEYANAANFCHDDIYRYDRFYQNTKKKLEEGRSLVRFFLSAKMISCVFKEKRISKNYVMHWIIYLYSQGLGQL